MDKKKAPLSIKANMFWNSFGSLINLGCSWLISVFIVRFANNFEAAGLYTLAMSIYAIFAPLAQYRTYVYQISDIRDEYTLGEYVAFRMFTSCLALISIVLYTFITNQASYIGIILLFSIYKLASLQIDVLHANMQKNKRMDYLGRSEATQGIVSLVLFIVVFLMTHDLSITLISMFLGMVGVGLLYDLPRVKLFSKIKISFSLPKIKKLLVTCLPIVVGGIAAAAAPNLPRQALNYVLGAEALGVYGTLAAPVALIQMGASYIYNPLLTYFVEAFDERDLKKFRRLVLYTLFGILLIMLLCGVFLVLFGQSIFSIIYGEKILGYLYLFPPLIVCAGVTGCMWFLNDLTQALRIFKATAIGNFIALGAAVVSMFPFIYLFGLNGVTFANLFSAALAIIFMVIFSLRKVKKRLMSK